MVCPLWTAAKLLITQIGAANVLLVDCASFLVFALAAATVRRPLRPQDAAAPADGNNVGAAPSRSTSVASLVRDRVIVATTVAFMAFNIAEGMLMVTGPRLAKNHLPGGAAVLGALLSAVAAGEIVGAALAGQRQPRRSRVRAIGVIQAAAAVAFLALLATPRQLLVGVLADRTGLTGGLSQVLSRRGFDPVHDRGWVLADVATAIACGARDIVDVEALRAQGVRCSALWPQTPPPAARWPRPVGGSVRRSVGYLDCAADLIDLRGQFA